MKYKDFSAIYGSNVVFKYIYISLSEELEKGYLAIQGNL